MTFVSYVSAQEEKPPVLKQGHGFEENEMVGVYNTPSRIDVRGAFDFEVTGSFIFWQVLEEGMNLGNYIDAGNRTSMIKMDSDFTPGFKLGVTYNSNFDDWKIFVQYTRLYTDDNGNFSSTEVLATPFWIYNDSTALNQSIKGTRDLHLNYVDILLSRPFYSGAKLTLNPEFGLKAASNSQELTIKHDQLGNNLVTVKTEDDNWLVGPELGCNANFLLGYGLKLYGNGMASILYQKHKISYNITDRDTASNNTSAQTYDKFLTPALELAGGLSWSSYFNNRSWHLDLLLGYEVQHFWEQNVLRGIDDLVRLSSDGKHGDLTLHGLTFKLAVVF